MAAERLCNRRSWRQLPGIFLFLLVLAGFASSLPARAIEPARLLLAERFGGEIDVAHYWVSEKLDGVRAIWDGKTLRFRSGNPVPAPRWFVDALPDRPLDGELWLGRGSFDQPSAIVRRQSPEDAKWRRVRYMIFELPQATGSFSERADQTKAVVAAANTPWLYAIPQFRVPDESTLQERLREIVSSGGEGPMLLICTSN